VGAPVLFSSVIAPMLGLDSSQNRRENPISKYDGSNN